MPEPKASLEEMAAIVQEEAEHIRGILAHYAKFYPESPTDSIRSRRAFVLESAASVLRIMGSFPDESRSFIVKLLAVHGRE